MMSKPAQGKEEEPAVPAFATRAPAVSAVQDLERRLAMLGGEEAAPAPLVDLQPSPPPVAVAPVAQVGTTTEKKPAAVKGGKNALLVRFLFVKTFGILTRSLSHTISFCGNSYHRLESWQQKKSPNRHKPRNRKLPTC